MYEYQYYSKKLNKVFDNVTELKKAEDEFEAKEQKKLEEAKEREAKAAKLKEEREARAKEIEEAIKARDEAQKKVNELTSAFINDYGAYHYTLRYSDVDGVIKNFFKFF